MPSRDEGGDLEGFSGRWVGGLAEVSCSCEEGSAQHLKRLLLLMREDVETVVATAKRAGDGRKEMARAEEMVAMIAQVSGDRWPV